MSAKDWTKFKAFSDLAIYDIESYPNIFTARVTILGAGRSFAFEVSERRDDWDKFVILLKYCKANRIDMAGWNNHLYDWIVIDRIMQLPRHLITAPRIRQINDEVIDTKNTWFIAKYGDYQFVKQWDLFLMGHYNNRRASLKYVECFQRRPNISETPYPFDQPVPLGGFDDVHDYNGDDVDATVEMAEYMYEDFVLRDEFMIEHPHVDARWFNSGKMGEAVYIKILGRENCYTKDAEGKKTPIRTERDSVALADVIRGDYDFKTPEFAAIHRFFTEQVVVGTRDVFALNDKNTPDYLEPFMHRVYTPTKQAKRDAMEIFNRTGSRDMADYPPRMNAFVTRLAQGVDVTAEVSASVKGLSIYVDGIVHKNGLGGLHSCRPGCYYTDDGYTIVDLDYKGFYPAVGEEKDLYPAHLPKDGVKKSSEYAGDLRDTYPKGSAGYELGKQMRNLMYGKSGDKHHFFNDNAYMFGICVNGQLTLYQLIELLTDVTDQVIQCNTDGITIRVANSDLAEMRERIAGYNGDVMIVEEEIYTVLKMKNVNNYVAIMENGYRKLKGEYEIDRLPYKDPSSLIIQRAAVAQLLDGIPIEQTIRECTDIYDFLCVNRVRGKDKLWIGNKKHSGKLMRYLVTIDGEPLVKKSMTVKGEKTTGINVGFLVEDYMDASHVEVGELPWNVDFNYYISQAEKLLIED